MKTLLTLLQAVFGTWTGYYDANSPECLSREEYAEMKLKQLPPWEAC